MTDQNPIAIEIQRLTTLAKDFNQQAAHAKREAIRLRVRP